ncbi:1-phosphofructokinase [Halanaerobaculum tunisiense]
MLLTITMNPAIDKFYAVDDFSVDNVFRPKEMIATAGGKGLNVARVANLLGEFVMASGLLGGINGEFIDKEVKKQGIESKFINVNGETRICINITDQKNTTSTEILENGPTISSDELENFLEYYDKLLDKCEVVVASGSLPKGVPSDFYQKLIKLAKQKEKKFILDTSGDYFMEGLKAIPYMIKPNEDEIEKIIDKEISSINDYAEVLLNFKEQGIELPIISLGKDGCITIINNQIYHFKPPVVEVKNTVGSGDSFIAGCAVALDAGEKTVDVVKLGMACGIANTQFSKTGFVSKELVNELLDQIEVNKLSI